MKYIFYVYKLITSEDPIKVYITGTSNRTKIDLQNEFYKQWISCLNTSSVTKKVIKSYPVLNKEEEELKTRYWVNKYKKYGYDVLTSLKEKQEEKNRIYVCLENVSMSEIVALFGDKIISISKEKHQRKKSKEIPTAPPPIIPPLEIPKIIQNNNSNIKKTSKFSNDEEISGEGYLGELKNILSKRNGDTAIRIKDLVKKRKPPREIIMPSNELHEHLIGELRNRMNIND